MAPPCATRRADRPSHFRHRSSLNTVSPGRASPCRTPIENAMSDRVFSLGHFSRAEVGQFSRAPKNTWGRVDSRSGRADHPGVHSEAGRSRYAAGSTGPLAITGHHVGGSQPSGPRVRPLPSRFERLTDLMPPALPGDSLLRRAQASQLGSERRERPVERLTQANGLVRELALHLRQRLRMTQGSPAELRGPSGTLTRPQRSEAS